MVALYRVVRDAEPAPSSHSAERLEQREVAALRAKVPRSPTHAHRDVVGVRGRDIWPARVRPARVSGAWPTSRTTWLACVFAHGHDLWRINPAPSSDDRPLSMRERAWVGDRVALAVTRSAARRTRSGPCDCTACRLPLAACRLPLAACRLPLAARRLPLAARLASRRSPLAACLAARRSRHASIRQLFRCVRLLGLRGTLPRCEKAPAGTADRLAALGRRTYSFVH